MIDIRTILEYGAVIGLPVFVVFCMFNSLFFNNENNLLDIIGTIGLVVFAISFPIRLHILLFIDSKDESLLGD